MIPDERKGGNESMMFYLKVELYATEGKEANTNLPDDKKDGNG